MSGCSLTITAVEKEGRPTCKLEHGFRATNGDVTIEAGDIMTLTSIDYKMFDGAAAETWRIDGTAAGSYHSIVFTDATANIIWTFPDGGTDTLAVMGSTLETNYPDVVNSVWGASNAIYFEGAAADAFESVITSADITGGDVTWTLADMGAADTLSVMGSTLATNAVGIVNSVWGGTNQFIFEGATDDAHSTALQPTDPTATNILTLPDDTGILGYMAEAGASVMTNADTCPLTDAVVLWSSAGADAGVLPDGQSAGQIVTIIVVSQAGGACTLTPTSVTGCGWATCVFTAVGESATFMYIDATIGWMCIGTAGVTTQPLLTQ